MGQQRDRRPHRFVGGQGHQRVRLRRSFDQQGAGLVVLQDRPDRPRRARSVVPHPQQQRPVRPGVHAPASRQAR